MPVEGSSFLFDIQDWRGSLAVRRMTWAQRGMYFEMLQEQWDSGSLPDDPAAVADILGGTIEEWTEAWPILRRKFVDRRTKRREGNIPTDHDAQRRIVNLRLEKTRRERRNWLARQKQSGQRGGLARARKEKELRASKPIASLQPQPSEPQALRVEKSREEKSRGEYRESHARAARQGSGVMAGMLPRDHLNCRPPCERVCLSQRQHAVLCQRHGGSNPDAALDAFYADVRARLDPDIPIGQTPWKFWDEQFAARFASEPVNARTAGNLAAAARFVARGQES